MYPLQQPADHDDGKPEATESVPQNLHAKTMLATGVQNPEALTGVEMTTINDANTQQKRDDLYLVCFDESYDAEKYGRSSTVETSKLTDFQQPKRLVHGEEMDSHRRSLRHRLQSDHGFYYHGSGSQYHRY